MHPLASAPFTRSGKSSPLSLGILASLVLAAPLTLPAAQGPCDIYAQAAHSTTRALFATYEGPLYQVTRTSDKLTKDIPPLSPGGVANVAVQDSFLAGKAGTISIVYDQTANHNDMKKSPKAYYLRNGGLEADASKGVALLGGHLVHGIQVDSNGVAYRNIATKGIATGDQPEAMYMVVDGKRYSSGCCFDYGNAETTGNDDGNGTMEAIYWGTNVSWGGPGDGKGPWVAIDLENGMFKSDTGGHTDKLSSPNNKSVIAEYATAMIKGPSGNKMGIKAGDAQGGKLVTMWDGPRPRMTGYTPKKLQGAIIIGTGGDGSKAGVGTFFEGVMTSGSPPDSIDDKIQENIVAAGYTRPSASTVESPFLHRTPKIHQLRDGRVTIQFKMESSGMVELEVFGLSGRRLSRSIHGPMEVGIREISWIPVGVSSGRIFARLRMGDNELWSGQILLER